MTAEEMARVDHFLNNSHTDRWVKLWTVNDVSYEGDLDAAYPPVVVTDANDTRWCIAIANVTSLRKTDKPEGVDDARAKMRADAEAEAKAKADAEEKAKAEAQAKVEKAKADKEAARAKEDAEELEEADGKVPLHRQDHRVGQQKHR